MDTSLYTLKDIYDLFDQIESAVDRHGKFQRKGSPDFSVSRLGCTFSIQVRLKSSRKRPGEIHGSGDNPSEAAEAFKNGLDHWAEAWK